jgi:hypothetical protein
MTKNILLYGNSIFLNGLAAWLKTQPGLTVRRHLPGDPLSLPDDTPDVAIVDIHETPVSEALALFEGRPHVTIVGVDDRLGTATVLSEQVYPLQTLDDVLHCLE